MWRKAPPCQRSAGRRLPPNLRAWAAPLLSRWRSFRSPSTGTGRQFPSGCATWHATWRCQTLRTGEWGLPGAGILLSPWMVAVIFCTGVGEQHWGSGHTIQQGEPAALGRVGGGDRATWGVAQLLGYARGTSVQWSSPSVGNKISGGCFHHDQVSAFEGKDTVHTDWLHPPDCLNLIPLNCIFFLFLNEYCFKNGLVWVFSSGH